jgi:hypothetical protein
MTFAQLIGYCFRLSRSPMILTAGVKHLAVQNRNISFLVQLNVPRLNSGKTSFERRNQPIVILVEMHLGLVALSSACSDSVGLRSIKVQKPATTACA